MMSLQSLKPRFLAIVTFILFSSFNALGDTPITSIKFWNLSKNKLVVKTGKKERKTKLTKKMIHLILDENQAVFDKIALVNALGWEPESELRNSATFLKAINNQFFAELKQKYTRADEIERKFYTEDRQVYEAASTKDKFELFSLLRAEKRDDLNTQDEFYLLYLYLLAMDNYNDVTFVENELVHAEFEDQNFETDENYTFVKTLISTQHLFHTNQLCEVGQVFERAFEVWKHDCMIKSAEIKNAVAAAQDYLHLFLTNCDRILYSVGNDCSSKKLVVKKNQLLWIVHYKTFIYGNLVVYDSANNKMEEHKIDGDDYVELNLSDYPAGSYKLKMKDIDDNSFVIDLKII